MAAVRIKGESFSFGYVFGVVLVFVAFFRRFIEHFKFLFGLFFRQERLRLYEERFEVVDVADGDDVEFHFFEKK